MVLFVCKKGVQVAEGARAKTNSNFDWLLRNSNELRISIQKWSIKDNIISAFTFSCFQRR
jgi:hypothetical protein